MMDDICPGVLIRVGTLERIACWNEPHPPWVMHEGPTEDENIGVYKWYDASLRSAPPIGVGQPPAAAVADLAIEPRALRGLHERARRERSESLARIARVIRAMIDDPRHAPGA